MNGRFVIFFARRLLRGRRGTARYLRGAVLGIAISLVPLVVVLEVSSGMIDGITARLLEVGTYHLQVALSPDTTGDELAAAAAAVAKVRGVVSTTAERQGTAMVVSATGAAGVTIRCVPPDVFSRDAGFRSYVTLRSGSGDLAAGDAVLLSGALARTLSVGSGDTVSILTTWGEDFSGAPRLTLVRVGGIFETGYQELDASLVYAPLALAARILSPRASRTLIGVKVSDPFGDLAPVQSDIGAALSGGVRVMAWRDIEYARLASFATTKALLLFIMALIVVVASVNVSSSVLMIIIERREELGILGSLGAGAQPLARSFLLAGFFTGLAGTFAGIGAGLLVAVNINAVIAGLEWLVNLGIAAASLVRQSFVPSAPGLESITLFNSAYYLKTIPIRIEPFDIGTVSVLCLVLSVLASYLPAARTARMRPLDVLRKV
jgi:lipoprotein-releasing system permease protein